MDRRPQGSACADAPQLDDITLSVAVFADGRDSSDLALAAYRLIDFLFHFIHGVVRLVIFPHHPIQVATLDDYE
ncbi:hypothetical protein D3C87_2149670 [compost metagenome]